jgi:hypothetical protein
MQIYYGLYNNEDLKKELEENEHNGKYKNIDCYGNIESM